MQTFIEKQFSPLFLFFLLLFCLIFPQTSLAQIEKEIFLPDAAAKSIIISISSQVRDEAVLSWSNINQTNYDLAAKTILAKALTKETFEYYFKNVPEHIFLGILKIGIKTAKIFYFPQSILSEIEKRSVGEATNYVLKYFQEKKIKIARGIITTSCNTYEGKEVKINLWYLIKYKEEEKDINKADVEITFYSPDPLFSLQCSRSQGYTTTLYYALTKGETLEPFSLVVGGKIELKKNLFGLFGYYCNWLEGPQIGEPDFSLDIPKAPEIREETFFEKTKPILTEGGFLFLDWGEKVKIFGKKTQEIINTIKKAIKTAQTIKQIKETFEKFKSLFSNIRLFKAELVEPSSTYQREEIKKEVEKSKAELKEIKEKLESLEKEGKIGETEKKEIRELKKALEKTEKEIKETEKKIEEKEKKEEKKELVKTLPKILVSEVCAGWDKAGNEFVELYNPNNFEVSLNEGNFNLKLVSSANTSTNKKLTFSRNKIPAKGYFLLVGGEIKLDGKTIKPDATFSSQLSGISGVILEDGEGNVLDKVAWGSYEKSPPSLAIETKGVVLEKGLKTGESLERKELKDTDNNSQDFVLNNNPSPTNSLGEKLVYYKKTEGSSATGTAGGAPSSAAGTSSSVSYLKILITEVQIASEEDTKDEFVELYNPNTTDVDLTGWYIQRKTKTSSDYSTFASSTLFSGKKIKAKDYFLVTREGSKFISLADIIVTNPLTEDNTLVLKNPSREEMDKVGWGAAQDFETAPAESPLANQSIGRKWDENNQRYQDTNNNSQDFEVQNCPNPKGQVIVCYSPPAQESHRRQPSGN